MEILIDALPEIIAGLVVAALITLIGYIASHIRKINNKSSSIENGISIHPKSSIKDKITLIPAGKKYSIFIDLEAEEKLKENVSGSSCGLAFSLKFAQEIFKKATEKELNYSIAATGIVDRPTENARIKKVEGINEKFRAALNCLKAGDKLFYPEENENEIEPALKNSFLKSGIILCPVSTVKEAIKLLFEGYLLKTPQEDFIDKLKYNLKKICSWKWLIILAIIASITIPYFVISDRIPSYNDIINSLYYGEYSKAKKEIDNGLNKTKDENLINQLKELSKKLSTDLHLSIQFEYYESEEDSTSLVSQGEIQQLSDLSLSNHDGYRFKISTNENCYFYLFQFDSNDGVELLYPLSSFSLENHFFLSNRIYSIPGGENYFYIQDDIHQGSVTIYFLCSFWRAKDIEQAYDQYEEAKPYQKGEFRDELLATIQKRALAIDNGIKGIFYKKEFFLKE